MGFNMNKKKFNRTYDEVLLQASLFHRELVRDFAEFSAFSPTFSSSFVEDFLSDIQAADSIPTKEVDLNVQVVLTMEVEEQMILARRHFQKLLLFVGIAWNNSESKLKAFGSDSYLPSRNSPSNLASLLSGLYNTANSAEYKDVLIAVGFSQNDIDLLNTLSEDLITKMNTQIEYKNHSFSRTEERITAYNKVWDSMVRISAASKMIFQHSPAKIEYYLLYSGSGRKGKKKEI
jgi:hypothetical protein